jgi:hypothetical protein
MQHCPQGAAHRLVLCWWVWCDIGGYIQGRTASAVWPKALQGEWQTATAVAQLVSNSSSAACAPEARPAQKAMAYNSLLNMMETLALIILSVTGSAAPGWSSSNNVHAGLWQRDTEKV